jgi:hypothetical protein
MSNPRLPTAKSWAVTFPTACVTKSAAKTIESNFPCNLLIPHDSDEEIQGNPRKSNLQNLGFSQRNGQEPRKPKSGRLVGPGKSRRRGKAESSGQRETVEQLFIRDDPAAASENIEAAGDVQGQPAQKAPCRFPHDP